MDLSEVSKFETKVEPWRKILRDAADYIAKHGLSCGGGEDHLRRPCVIHAIGKVSIFSMGLYSPTPEYDEAIKQVSLRLPTSLPSWSDAAGREGRASEVIAKLREVANS